MTMSTASWTNDRHASACAATDNPGTATSAALVDGVAWRIGQLETATDTETIAGLRYSVTRLLAELGKRHGGNEDAP
jgi:hypothetical protein